MNVINDLILFILVITAWGTFTIAHHILAKTSFSRFIFCLAVSGLSILGLWALPNGLIKLILLFYALFASVLLFTLLWSFLLKILRMLFDFAQRYRSNRGLNPCRKDEEHPLAR